MLEPVTLCRYMCEQCSQDFENMDYFIRHACTLQEDKVPSFDTEVDTISKAAIETVVKKLRPNKPGVQQTIHCIEKSESHDAFVKNHILSLASENRGFFIEKEVRDNFYACRCDRSSKASGQSTGLPSKTRANSCNAYISFKFYPMLNVDVCVVRFYDVHNGHDLDDSDHYRANRIDPDLIAALESWAEGGMKATPMLKKSVEWAYAHGFRDILDRRYFISMSDVKYIWQRKMKRLRRLDVDDDCPITSKKARCSEAATLNNDMSAVITPDNLEEEEKEEEEMVTESPADVPECIDESPIKGVDVDEAGSENNDGADSADTNHGDMAEAGSENNDCADTADKNDENFTIISKLMMNNRNRRAPTITVTKDEIRRRVEKPEMMTPNTLRGYLHVGHHKIKCIREYLKKHKLPENNSTRHTTIFSSIPEDDCAALADSYKNLAMQYIPFDKVTKHHRSTIEYSSPSSEEWINTLNSTRTILTTIVDSCLKYSQNFDLTTHGFGAKVLASSASIIDVLLEKEIQSMKSAGAPEDPVCIVDDSDETSTSETDELNRTHPSSDSPFPIAISDELAMAPATVPAESDTSQKMLKEMMLYMQKMEDRLEKRVLNAIQTKPQPVQPSPVHVEQQPSQTRTATSLSGLAHKTTHSNPSTLSTTLQDVLGSVNHTTGLANPALRLSFPVSVTLTPAQTSAETRSSKPFMLNIIPTTMKSMVESDNTVNKQSKDVT